MQLGGGGMVIPVPLDRLLVDMFADVDVVADVDIFVPVVPPAAPAPPLPSPAESHPVVIVPTSRQETADQARAFDRILRGYTARAAVHERVRHATSGEHDRRAHRIPLVFVCQRGACPLDSVAEF